MLGAVAVSWMLWTVFAAIQTSMLFPEPAVESAPVAPPQAQRWQLPSGQAWYLPAAERDLASNTPVVVMLHGNGELARHWLRPLHRLATLGWATVVVEYPGYDAAGPRPSLDAAQEHVDAVYRRIQRQLQPSHSVGWGRSLGGLILARSAAACQFDGIMLFSSVVSLPKLAAEHGWPAWTAPRADMQALLDCPQRPPLRIWHGHDDHLVPPKQVLALSRSLGLSVLWQDCAHNNCTLPWPDIDQALRSFQGSASGFEDHAPSPHRH